MMVRTLSGNRWGCHSFGKSLSSFAKFAKPASAKNAKYKKSTGIGNIIFTLVNVSTFYSYNDSYLYKLGNNVVILWWRSIIEYFNIKIQIFLKLFLKFYNTVMNLLRVLKIEFLNLKQHICMFSIHF